MKSSERGNIVIAFIVVLLMATFQIYFFISQHARDAATTQRRYLVQGSAKEVLSAANQLLTSPKSLMNSVRGSLNKTDGDLERCMSDGTYDCPSAGGPFSIYQDDPALVFSNAVDDAAGINFAMQSCQSYTNSGDSFCAMKLKLIWKPACPTTGSCFLPPIDIQGVVEIKDSFLDRMVFNLDPYKFTKRIR